MRRVSGDAASFSGAASERVRAADVCTPGQQTRGRYAPTVCAVSADTSGLGGLQTLAADACG